MPPIDDILAEPPKRRPRPVTVEVAMVVEDRASGFCGEVIAWDAAAVSLRDRDGRVRQFRWKPEGFLLEGRPVTLARPTATPASAAPVVSNSGALVDSGGRARVARAARIWVEGRHDAELIEHVWGDELREAAIVVEPMHGADDLAARVRAFGPRPRRRLGVLLDHLVAGSKESRLAAQIDAADVLICGHPFVDVWAGIRPEVLGLSDWPDVPRGIAWKQGLCEALGEDLDGFWPRLRNRVGSYADLRPELVGAVEQLIDFVIEGD
jgi:hypothetical protein